MRTITVYKNFLLWFSPEPKKPKYPFQPSPSVMSRGQTLSQRRTGLSVWPRWLPAFSRDDKSTAVKKQTLCLSLVQTQLNSEARQCGWSSEFINGRAESGHSAQRLLVGHVSAPCDFPVVGLGWCVLGQQSRHEAWFWAHPSSLPVRLPSDRAWGPASLHCLCQMEKSNSERLLFKRECSKSCCEAVEHASGRRNTLTAASHQGAKRIHAADLVRPKMNGSQLRFSLKF